MEAAAPTVRLSSRRQGNFLDEGKVLILRVLTIVSLSVTFALRRAAVTTCSRRVVEPRPEKAPKLRWRADGKSVLHVIAKDRERTRFLCGGAVVAI